MNSSLLTAEKAQILPLFAILMGLAAIVMFSLVQLGNKAIKIAETDVVIQQTINEEHSSLSGK